MQPILPVTGREPPRVVLAVDFPSLQGGLPVQGGWGYAMEDACVFDKADPLVDPGLPFDFVGMEYIFVQKRTYEEMIICRPEGQKFSGIDWELLELLKLPLCLGRMVKKLNRCQRPVKVAISFHHSVNFSVESQRQHQRFEQNCSILIRGHHKSFRFGPLETRSSVTCWSRNRGSASRTMRARSMRPSCTGSELSTRPPVMPAPWRPDA